ncbi:probable protein phosphatase 2C 40 [Magnolia sinica]|uniref:probable protein phosphatase 2C 40 n=1 Tax=Magnolia sinica TaxID=86752 RepID=UPI002657E52E|nr:probable protein phosphatase 2C 40 [Magnolia sinica]XP_058083346.1 probable protein phosphatase 2C 40 [Magnolia sinica]
MLGKTLAEPGGELNVSFGYQFNGKKSSFSEASDGFEAPPEVYDGDAKIRRRSSSFSCLSGAALSANATLANTNICNGLIGAGILPGLDSPTSFRRVPSSPSISRLDMLSSSLQSNISTLSGSLSTHSESFECDSSVLKSMSAPSRSEGFLNAVEVEMAGGAAGEDRVQAICSEEDGWVFCAIYDGFNGRDAADFLAGTLYENIGFYLNLLDRQKKQQNSIASDDLGSDGSLLYFLEDGSFEEKSPSKDLLDIVWKEDGPPDPLKDGVVDSLRRALSQAESEFLNMVEQEMDDRPDLVSVGSCVLVVLLYGKDLYTLNLGDSRAVLATMNEGVDVDGTEPLEAVQLTESHSVDNETERMQLLHDHPDDPSTIVAGRVKGKLKLTRAFGVGYLKKRKMNDALMGILQVRNLLSPPYISTKPSLSARRVSNGDCFVIAASDGLFDFFSNDEAVQLVHSYIKSSPHGDPAKFLLEQLLLKAADNAGLTMEELMRIPAGCRRKYHDDVTVIVILLGSDQRMLKASTCL